MSNEGPLIVEAGAIRLDKFLADRYPGYSRAHLKDLAIRGCVFVNGTAAKPSKILAEGDKILVRFPGALPESDGSVLEGRVLFEDKAVLILDKPAGLLMHPFGGSWLVKPRAAMEDSILNLAGVLYSERPEIAAAKVARCGIVHRLDRPTSGALVVAKTPAAYESLLFQFRERLVKKVYLAVVLGKVSERELVIDAPVGRAPRGRRVTANPFGRESSTGLRLLSALDAASLLEARPLTGRTHQIRAHLSLAGHPVLGDPSFGSAAPAGIEVPRLMLHALNLEFMHPVTGRKVAFRAEPPADFLKCWRDLGGRPPRRPASRA